MRKEVEDRLHAEQEHRREMEDILHNEREKLANTSEMLAKELNNRFLLEQNMLMQNEDLQSTRFALSEVKQLLRPPVPVEPEIDSSSVEVVTKPEDEMTDEEILQAISDPKIRAQIEASTFLFDRAMELHEQGWYKQAQPLFFECFLVRDKYIHRVAITSETLFFIAKNFSLSHEWDAAQDSFKNYLRLKDRYTFIVRTKLKFNLT